MSFYSNSNVEARPLSIDLAAIMRQVYLWMTLGLAVSGVTAFGMAASGISRYFFGNPILMIVTMLAYIVLALALQPIIMRAQPSVGTILYLVVTALLGVMLSSIFFTYRINTIAYAFIATTATFGTMSFIGYTTKRDLSGMGSILMMALIGLIIASIVNLFLPSNALYWLINYAGVLIFVGLTAYDTQWIKNFASQASMSGDPNLVQRVSLIGAFHLYLDFVNLFLFILRIMGGGRGGRR
jgi:FtsH-binding integral membrane protein